MSSNCANSNALLAAYFARIERSPGLRWRGRVTQVIGPLVESEGPFCSVGEVCEIVDSRGRTLPGEIVGFRDTTVLSMPLELPSGIRYGDRVSTWGERPTIRVGDGLLGRVMDGSGEPLDSMGRWGDTDTMRSTGRRRCRSSVFRSASRWAAAFEPSMDF